jgi:hypothetical protein
MELVRVISEPEGGLAIGRDKLRHVAGKKIHLAGPDVRKPL